ncbi:MBL fold metallo-hydrolase [Tuwongella immobilis]|uniref:Metallo-beta-lactamase domain-containing protein n=1 Tax=Tuwongella immobilis TaxID=692036 RepID=A0A6C2YM41_9BACT|nr:MBL fold metallo-hydrolase [Tuwongella immobilis]VIP02381.1 beta-lactamase : Zn-dependent hydrolase, glyoxylase OS=Singulisphaera acidiphila (strain ATCC BAA-1392 / DSM 18658 / VKM B-2454 / MOB10) GN=Sinac_6729 PE=4 SV=1: Lactamase_B [Tuwongella immobilis]VTS01229.1 beta-lactamase : Zn-dependent hydrolase, glyoxylase OS=Singulisphaera acidiphila (strain ATCC BAA-1392 / DSM 18658 / VKM B-2454 / MOB10) GN=Sinac_6729 PE=4 SV=1: Lactamase_B [Tuwongella immobilis]
MRTELQTIVSEPFMQNSTVLWKSGQSQALVFDPGMDPEAILDVLVSNNLTLAAILLTHGHADHIAGNAVLKAAFPDAPIVIGVNEAALLTDAELNLSAAFGVPFTSPPADRLIHDGEIIEYAGWSMEVLEIPGHSPGHVVFRIAELQPQIIIGGDVLFRGGIGRTDFPGGSMKQLLSGIHQKLRPLPEDTVIYPGHGPVTTLGHEWRTNQFLTIKT